MNAFFLSCLLFVSTLPSLSAQSPLTEERIERALQEESDGTEQTNQFYSELMNVVLVLALIILFMIVAAYYVRKFMQGRMEQINETSSIKILEQRNLSARCVVYIVEAQGIKFLVGETAAGVVGLGQLTGHAPIPFKDVYKEKSER